MRILGLVAIAAVSAGCDLRPVTVGAPSAQLAAAERFIDAFYSFDGKRLRQAMAGAERSMAKMRYYQGWAQGGNYAVVDRKPCRFRTASDVICDVTVRDDLIAALGTGYHVTDRFQLSFRNGRLVGVDNSSNDPPEFSQAMQWLGRERPELLTGPCRGFFAGGPTPGDCVRAVVKGFADYTARRRSAAQPPLGR